MEMETTGGDEYQARSNGNQERHPENESSSIASVASMDSSGSNLSSSKDAKTNDSRNTSSNISELVGKSKKAAFSLWTLLHAKNCRLGVDRCSHPGCSEAKLMYLHHKTCSAVSIEACPTQHKGCQDARKLLAHYRRCRDIRARQSQNPGAKSKKQHVCLICSLVARHAKFTLDRNASKNKTTCHYIPSLNLSYDSCNNGKRNRSLSAATYFSSNHESPQQPRFAFSRRQSSSGDGGASGLQALQAAVSCAINSSNNSPTHSSNGVERSVGVRQSLEHSTNNVEKSVGGRQSFQHATNDMEKTVGGRQSLQRPRAESLDVRRVQQQDTQEKNMSYLYLAAVDNFSDDLAGEIPKNITQSNARRRSLSCSVPSKSNQQSATGGGSRTIIQKSTVAEDFQYIWGGNS